MAQTPRERVRRALTFEGPDRVPRNVWALPAGRTVLDAMSPSLAERYPADMAGVGAPYRPSSRRTGSQHEVGLFVDEWGCVWENAQAGHVGQPKTPIVADLDEWSGLEPPYEVLPEPGSAARDEVNRQCAETDVFTLSGCNPRPWERYQFLRKPENALMDMADPDRRVRGLLGRIHDFYLKELEFWCSTDVDCVTFMDDWGSQRQLLVRPELWREVFKPLYREYVEMIHAAGKFAFMHSDGHILEIYPELIAIGLDAVNSQLFCMDMDDLARVAKGRITFWGEIDRQHVMNSPDPEDGRRAVREVARTLYDPAGGVVAQFEFAGDSNPEVALAVFREWDLVSSDAALAPS